MGDEPGNGLSSDFLSILSESAAAATCKSAVIGPLIILDMMEADILITGF